MHKKMLAAVLATLACGAASAEPPTPLRADHPILGNWVFALPDGKCTETHLIREDGTTIVTSGDEVSESVVEVDDRPDAAGWYRWVDQVVRNNGKLDCGASTTPIGDVATTYMRFDRSGDRMMVCFDKTGQTCFGPLVRQRPRNPSSM